MKASNSKKQLAKIISDNGGWFDGANWAVQGRQTMGVGFSKSKPYRKGDGWFVNNERRLHHFVTDSVLPNWHQTIVSRDEYFQLYPAPDADGWIEWIGGECPVESGAMVEYLMVGETADIAHVCKAGELRWDKSTSPGDIVAYRLHKSEKARSTAVGYDETNLAAKEELEAMEYRPSIEQLTADYRAKLAIAQQAQEEADSHRCGAEAALDKLYQAGLAIGLDIAIYDSEPEDKRRPELVITDWRDLQVGDEVEYLAGKRPEMVGAVRTVVGIDANCPYGQHVNLGNNVWPREWRFIRRP